MYTNERAYSAGFTTANSVANALCAVARKTVAASKTATVGTAHCTTSFFAGMRQAIRSRNGKCLALSHEVTKP